MAEGFQSLEFEVRLLGEDGSRLIRMYVSALDLPGASERVRHMLKDDVASATIWFDGTLIATLYADRPTTSS